MFHGKGERIDALFVFLMDSVSVWPQPDSGSEVSATMIKPEVFFGLLQRLGGYYECPVRGGVRQGPLVGYAQRDERGRQYVGDVYADCSVLEGNPAQLLNLVLELRQQLVQRAAAASEGRVEPFAIPKAVMGLPFGGLSVAFALAAALDDENGGCRYLFPEFDLVPGREGEKPKKVMVFGRHEPREGEGIVLAEDVGNAFSTVAENVALVEKCGAHVTGIACLLNRSSQYTDSLPLPGGRRLPIFAVVQRPFPSYRQDDPAVAADVARGNVVWSPKKERARLQAAMVHAR